MHKENIDDLRKLFIGLDKKVNVDGKGRLIPINFDNAATTPPFKRVMKKVLETSEYYGSIARGDGKKSQYCSDLYENSRKYILEYFNAPEDIYTAIFVANTTDGLNKLSMRSLADKLEIKASSLYWYFKNKDEVLLYISEYICQKFDYSKIFSSSREELVYILSQYRDILNSIQDSAKIMQLTPPITPGRQKLINHVVKLITDLGIPDKKIFVASNLINNYVISFVLDEISFKSIPSNINSSIMEIDIPGFNLNLDDEFLKGLNIILDGIEFQSKY